MDHDAGRIEPIVVGVGWRVDDVALQIDGDQIRGADFVIQIAERIDQQVIGAWHPQRDVVVDQVGHSVAVQQAITGGKLHTGLPFIGADLPLDLIGTGRRFSLARRCRLNRHGISPTNALGNANSVQKIHIPGTILIEISKSHPSWPAGTRDVGARNDNDKGLPCK